MSGNGQTPQPAEIEHRDIPPWALKLARRVAALQTQPGETEQVHLLLVRLGDGRRILFVNGGHKGEILGG